MKKKRVKKLPTCDFCPTDAKYDAKTTAGCWAYMCPECAKTYMSPISKECGTEFILGIAEPKKDLPILQGIEVDIEEAIMGDRYIQCQCGEQKLVEPDAEYVYDCEGCGQRVQCPSII